jgi:hypothetical protein
MYFNNIIFQTKINDIYSFGLCKLNILDYGILEYQHREENNDETENITKEIYIQKWIYQIFLKYYKQEFNSKIMIMEIYENTETTNQLHFDIIIEQDKQKIKMMDLELDTEIYNELFKIIHNNSVIHIEKDYDDDELEYIVDWNYIYKKVGEEFDKYLDEEGDIKEEYEEEVKMIENNNQGLCLEEILQNKYKNEYEERYKHMKEEDFKTCKIEDVEKRLNILKFLMKKYKTKNSSFYEYCVNKYLTQKIRKYRYTDYLVIDKKYVHQYSYQNNGKESNLEKIRYNFIVTSYDFETEHNYEEIVICFKSLTYDVKGKGKCIQMDDRYGKKTTFECSIEDKDNKYDFDENFFCQIINEITDEFRYYS